MTWLSPGTFRLPCGSTPPAEVEEAPVAMALTEGELPTAGLYQLGSAGTLVSGASRWEGSVSMLLNAVNDTALTFNIILTDGVNQVVLATVGPLLVAPVTDNSSLSYTFYLEDSAPLAEGPVDMALVVTANTAGVPTPLVSGVVILSQIRPLL